MSYAIIDLPGLELRLYAWYVVLYGEEMVCMDHFMCAIRLSGFVVIDPKSCR